MIGGGNTFPVFLTKYSAANPPSSRDERYNHTTIPQAHPPITPDTIPKIRSKIQLKTYFDMNLTVIFGFLRSIVFTKILLPLAVALAQTIEKAIGTTLEAIRIPVK